MTTKPKGTTSTAEGRRAYQRAYYYAHQEKAKEYQRIYNKTHKKPRKPFTPKPGFLCPREEVKTSYTHSDVVNMPVGDRFVDTLNRIIRREAVLAKVG